MTDREMLELTAKAMGFNDASWDATTKCIFRPLPVYRSYLIWNPLAGDGDCFRMETELRINVYQTKEYVQSSSYDNADIWYMERHANHKGDKGAARRLASCKVAAMIGREMK